MKIIAILITSSFIRKRYIQTIEPSLSFTFIIFWILDIHFFNNRRLLWFYCTKPMHKFKFTAISHAETFAITKLIMCLQRLFPWPIIFANFLNAFSLDCISCCTACVQKGGEVSYQIFADHNILFTLSVFELKWTVFSQCNSQMGIW